MNLGATSSNLFSPVLIYLFVSHGIIAVESETINERAQVTLEIPSRDFASLAEEATAVSKEKVTGFAVVRVRRNTAFGGNGYPEANVIIMTSVIKRTCCATS